MQENELKKRTVKGTFLLFVQTAYSGVLGLITNIILTIYLDPTAFGVYIAVLAAIAIFNYISDVGLGGALIQKKILTPSDIKTTFTLQLLITIVLITIAFWGSSALEKFYSFPEGGLELYYALLAAYFLSSLKSVPSLLLEREVQFKKIVLVQATEQTVFNIAVSALAIAGAGLYSFMWAILLRAVIGTTLMYSLTRFKPAFGVSLLSVKELLSFGLPFQASSFLALIKDEFTTLYLSKILGFAGMGYIGWAKKWADMPLRLIMDNISKALFPLFSRLQDNKSELGKVVEKTLLIQTTIIAPVYAFLITAMDTIVAVIPKYNKWEVAVPLFVLFSLSSVLSSFSTPFITILNALKKTTLTFLFMVMWTTLTWVLVPTLTLRYGMYGFPITSILLSTLFIVVVGTTKRFVPFSFIKPVAPAVVSSMLAAFIAQTTITLFGPTPLLGLVSACIVGGVAYLVILTVFFRVPLIKLVKEIWHKTL